MRQRVTLRLESLGPLRDAEIEIGGSLVVFFGEPGAGKSYAMRALYSGLSVLDPAARVLCRPPSFPVTVSGDGAARLSRLLAALSYSAVDTEQSPARWAQLAGLRLSRFTIRKRGRGVGRTRSISIEARLRRDSQFVLARYEHGLLASSYTSRMRNCTSRLLLPPGVRFRVEPADDARPDPPTIGARRLRLLEELETRVPGGCRVSSGPVWLEVVYENGSVLVRGLNVEELEVEEGCLQGIDVKELAGQIEEAVSWEEAARALSRGLRRSVATLSARKMSEATGYGDVLYLAFVRSAALWLRSAMGRLGLWTARLIRRILRYPETAVIGISYTRIGLGVRREEVTVLDNLFSAMASGKPVMAAEGGIVFMDERSGQQLPPHMVSALASEASATVLALRGARSRPLVLLEEPEAQLHPRLQVALAAILPAAAEALSGTIVVSTHSDLLVSSLAAAASINDRGVLRRRTARLLRITGLQDAEEAADLAAAAFSRGVSFYLFKGGRVEGVDPSRLQREAPSYTAAYEAVLSLLSEGEHGAEAGV